MTRTLVANLMRTVACRMHGGEFMFFRDTSFAGDITDYVLSEMNQKDRRKRSYR